MNQFDLYDSRIYYLPLMLAVALREESGDTIEENSKARQLWDTAVRKTAAVDLDSLKNIKDTPLSKLSNISVDNTDTDGLDTEHWIANVQTILEEMGFGPPNPPPVPKEAMQSQANSIDPDKKSNKKRQKKKKKKGGGAPPEAASSQPPQQPPAGGFQGFGGHSGSSGGGLDWGALRR